MSEQDKKEIRHRNGAKLCRATSKRTKEPCGAVAMAGKDVCYHHGGKAGRPIKHGLYSKRFANQPTIAERIEQLKNDPELTNIASHLAAVVAVLEKVIEGLTPDHQDYEKTVETLSLVVDRIAKIKEREHKIQIGYYLKPEQVELLKVALAGCIKKTCANCPSLPKLADDISKIPMPD